MASAFQRTAFQFGAFQMGVQHMTSTVTLQKPVDCVLAGDQEEYPDRRRPRGLPIRQGRLGRAMMRHTFNE